MIKGVKNHSTQNLHSITCSLQCFSILGLTEWFLSKGSILLLTLEILRLLQKKIRLIVQWSFSSETFSILASRVTCCGCFYTHIKVRLKIISGLYERSCDDNQTIYFFVWFFEEKDIKN